MQQHIAYPMPNKPYSLQGYGRYRRTEMTKAAIAIRPTRPGESRFLPEIERSAGQAFRAIADLAWGPMTTSSASTSTVALLAWAPPGSRWSATGWWDPYARSGSDRTCTYGRQPCAGRSRVVASGRGSCARCSNTRSRPASSDSRSRPFVACPGTKASIGGWASVSSSPPNLTSGCGKCSRKKQWPASLLSVAVPCR
jgi:hypothetical protein